MVRRGVLISDLVKGFLVLVAIWGVLALFAAYKTRAVRNEAEEFMAELMRLRVGESTFDQIAPLIAIYNGQWRRSETPAPELPDVTPCGRPYRRLDFAFENRWLHWILFAPRTEFGASIDLRDNRVCFRSVGMITTAADGRVVGVSEFREGRQERPFNVVFNQYKTVVTMTAAAAQKQRDAAYSIKLDCLMSLKGCRAASEMAPGVWRLYER